MAAGVEAVKLEVPNASETVSTPLDALAETMTRTVPLRKSVVACPSAPTTATEAFALDVPAVHFPETQTG